MPTLPVSRMWGRSFQRYYPVVTRRSAASTSLNTSLTQASPTQSGLNEDLLGAAATRESARANSEGSEAVPLHERIMQQPWFIFARITVMSLVVAFVMLAWPVGVGVSADEELTMPSFGAFQLLYTLITFPVLMLQAEIPIGQAPWSHRIVLLVTGQVIVQGFIIIYANTADLQSLGLVRTLGTLVYGVEIFLYFAVKSFWFKDSFVERLLQPNGVPESVSRQETAAGGGALLDAPSPSSVSMATAQVVISDRNPPESDQTDDKKADDDREVAAELALPPRPEDDNGGSHDGKQRERLLSRAYVGVHDDSHAQFARLGAVEDTSFAGPAASSSSPQNSAAGVSATSLAFEADLGQDSCSAFLMKHVDKPLEQTTFEDMLLLERRFIASQLHCPVESWFLDPRLRSPLWRYVFYIICALACWAIYFFVQWCAQSLFAAPKGKKTTHPHRTLLEAGGRYLLFSSVVIVLGFFAKRFARGCDTLKTVAFARRRFPRAIAALRAQNPAAYPRSVLEPQSCGAAGCALDRAAEGAGRDHLVEVAGLSFEVMTHFMVCLFYGIFFRVLFQELESWHQFAVVSAVHVAVVLLAYPFRMTRPYFKIAEKAQVWLRGVPLLSLIYDPSNGAQWNTRIAQDYMAHFATAITATCAFLVFSTFLRFGYNSDRYVYFGAGWSDDDFAKGMGFVAAGGFIELLVTLGVALSTRGLVRGGMSAPLTSLLRAQPKYQLFLGLAGAHVCTDVFLAHVVLGAAHQSSAVPTPSPS